MSKYTVIRSPSELQAGDHISWPTRAASGMLNHHAIVVAARGGSKFKVIHATGNDGPAKDRCSVCEQIIDFEPEIRNARLRRYDYAPDDCNEPAEVIQNGRSKLGKFDYDVLNNNCEHFAQWCKTGNRQSRQADVAKALIGSASAVSFSM